MVHVKKLPSNINLANILSWHSAEQSLDVILSAVFVLCISEAHRFVH